MSRQDTTILNPFFEVEQIVHAMQTEYILGYNVKTARQKLTLEAIKLAVENELLIEDMTKNTRRRPYPEARQLFVKVAYLNYTLDEGEIMEYIGKHRTSFYHSIKQAESLIETDKLCRQAYDNILISLGL